MGGCSFTQRPWHCRAGYSTPDLWIDPFCAGSTLNVLADLTSPDPATAAQAAAAVFNTLMQEPDAAFDATTSILGLSPGIPGASGHAAVYVSANFGLPIVLLAGFDLNESHLAEEEIDYGDPAITARTW